ncbi:MAG: methionine biosynthesis protein MetW [Porticoccaceae bacterium]|nr:methionine biosynthesis protein MetW [Porticoccaceae bacterium]
MLRIDLDILQQWITPDSRVLDLGCGQGDLLRALTDNHQIIEGYGLEIDPENIATCIGKGVNVIEQDLNEGLSNFADDSFDIVVMTYSLQVLRRPDLMIDEMLRVGRECIVTFPNFGHIRTRCSLLFRGRMPVTKQLSHQWYDTPNIHFCTVRDFEDLCRLKGIRILDRSVVAEQNPDKALKALWPNAFGTTAIYRLTR